MIPDTQVQFAQLAVKQKLVSPEQVRTALELFRRYQKAGGETPSIGRILVQKGLLNRSQAEVLLRHLMKGEPLPPANAVSERRQAAPPPIAPPPAQNVAVAQPDFDVLDELGLEPPGSAIDLPVGSAEPPPVVDERKALIEGLGATVLPKELKDIKGYKITNVIGEGSMGIVYRAHQISMDRAVALKVLPAARTKDARFVEEFLTEARNAGRLNHPNLIRVHEVTKTGETYYYSMEYVEGQRLDEWMDEMEGGRLEAKQVINVFSQVGAALDYGFRSGIIHREIRPNTIMVGDDGQAKLADLGLTKDEETRFLDGENAYYVSPEQVKGLDPDTRADIYSLGCCMFHCLTGELPFEGGGPKEVLSRRITAPTPDPCTFNSDVPRELASVVMKMMARDPNSRYQTPAEMVDALKRLAIASAPAKKAAPTTGPIKKPIGKTGLRRPISGRSPTARRKFRR